MCRRTYLRPLQLLLHSLYLVLVMLHERICMIVFGARLVKVLRQRVAHGCVQERIKLRVRSVAGVQDSAQSTE